MKSVFKIIFRILLGVLLLFFGLLLLLCLFLFVPQVQEFVSQKASTFVSDKIGTKVELEGLYLEFPNGVSINQLYVEDQASDTLIYAGNLEVAVDYFALLHGELEVSNLLLENCTANIKVAQDSSFNFDYIIDAFASNPTTDTVPQDTSSSSLSFDIGDIELIDVRFSYYTEPDGMSTTFDVGRLYFEVDQFDIEEQIYTANKIELSNTDGKFEIFKSIPISEESNTETIQLIVGSETINISQTNFQFIDKTSNTEFSTKIGFLNLEAEPIDLAKQKIEVGLLKIDSSEVYVKINSALAIDSASNDSKAPESGSDWLVNLQVLDLNLFEFKFDDVGSEKTNKGIDYAHLDLKINQLKSESIHYHGIEDLEMQLNQLSATEQSGFNLKQAAFVFKMDATSIQTEELRLITPNTSIAADVKLGYESMSSIAEKLGELKVQLAFNQTKVGLSDLNYFAPDLDTIAALKPYLQKDILIDGKLNGAVNKLNFSNWTISLAQATTLKLNGKLSGLPETDQLAFNFNQIQLKTNPRDLNALLPDSAIPNSIHLPPTIKLHIKADGKLADFNAQLALETSYGNLNSELDFQQPDNLNTNYLINLEIPSFDVAQLLQDTLLGNIGFKGEINGKGLKLDEMELDLDASVKDFEYANYRYQDLVIKGLLQEGFFEGEINMNDSNLIFDFTGIADLDSIKPSYDFDFNLAGIDLQQLNFTTEDYRINGKLSANFEGNSLENLNGNLDVRDILIIYNGEQYRIDSLLFLSLIDSGKTDLSIKSSLLDASFKGNIYLSDLGDALETHFSGQLNDSLKNEYSQKEQDFTFDLQIHDPDILTEVLLPDLNSFETGIIHGEFDSRKDYLFIEVNFPSVNYANVLIDSLRFYANSDSNQIKAALSVNRVAYDTLSLENISFVARAKQKQAKLNLRILDSHQEKLLQLNAVLKRPNNNYSIQFTQEQQFINKNEWKVNSENQILFGDSLIFKALELKHEDQQLSVITKGIYHELDFSNFELDGLFNIIRRNQTRINKYASDFDKFQAQKQKEDSTSEEKPALLSGNLNGIIKFPVDSNAFIKANIQISELTTSNIKLGDLQAQFTQLPEGDSLAINLSGNGNKMNVSGFVAKDEIDLNLDIARLDMKVIEAFSSEQLQHTKGYLTAKAKLSQSNERYNSSGEIGFHEVQLKSLYLGERYYLKNEKITFSNDKIVFQNFTILDSAKQDFKIDGYIGTTEFSNPTFNFGIQIDKFQFLNTTKDAANDLFYGQVLASANLKVRGDLKKPRVNAQISLEKGTEITFVVPNEEASEVNREGIVEFVDKDEKIPLLLRKNKNQDTVKMDIQGIDLTALIKIDENTNLTLVIDPVTGDRLNVQGGGEIRTDIDPNGRINMNGLYTIKQGDYELKLYNLVKREFAIKKGSKLIWSGSPLEAAMDIQGVYTAKASPLGLLDDQVSNMTDAERNKLKKRMPFEVLLILGGEILRPDVSFRINIAEDEKAKAEGVIANKLAQLNEDESELNRQVFSLILFKRFYSSNPFGEGGGGSYAARESVSQILSQQLNNVTDKYVKGVDVELNVDSYNDYSETGDLEGSTDLNLAVSKKLFNDRVIVRVDGDFNVENNNPQSSSNAVAGDVSVEYKITENGRYRAKIYRKDDYDGIIEGDYIVTGVALIYTKEFVKFRDLFKKEEEIETNAED